MTAEPPDAPSSNALTLVPPPPDLAPGLFGFVRRIDPGCGGVVRTLPEIRSSIQVHAADPYWVREQAPDAEWRQAPRVSLWGPRHDWGWGYARRDVSAYAVGLTPAGLAALTGVPAPDLVNQVRPAAAVDPALAALDAAPDVAPAPVVARAPQGDAGRLSPVRIRRLFANPIGVGGMDLNGAADLRQDAHHAAAAGVDAPYEAEQPRRQIRRRRDERQGATLWCGGHGRILQSRRRKSG